jgi:hypothetical protein
MQSFSVRQVYRSLFYRIKEIGFSCLDHEITLPRHDGCSDRGFFITTKFSFDLSASDFSDQPRKEGLIIAFPLDSPRDFVPLVTKEGELPLLTLAITLNKDEFSPLKPGEDFCSWVEHTGCQMVQTLAHEVLYLKQYAEKWDADSWGFLDDDPIELVLTEDEEDLICSYVSIEKALTNFESTYDVELTRRGLFEGFLQRKEGGDYLSRWMEAKCVDRNIVESRTTSYLDTKIRTRHLAEITPTTLDQMGCDPYSISINEWKQIVKNDSEYYHLWAANAQCDDKYVDDELINFLTKVFFKNHNGS